MRKSSSTFGQWQQWLSFSAFTLAGVGFEGSAPPSPKAKPAASRRRTPQS
ncbi:hypothetical protein [Pantoea agglomerans]|nr:hypothetical protein [Pantoea agglomerans]UBN55617.1 hypothetical protein LB453_08755 [Pantoea agglomerans]